jgi:hypothetical protein
MDITIGTVEVAALVVGIVQTIKLFWEPDSKVTMGIALLVGTVLLATAEVLGAGYLSNQATEIVTMIVRVLSYATAIPGWFSVGRDEVVANLVRKQ